jgi:hypothetical protein
MVERKLASVDATLFMSRLHLGRLSCFGSLGWICTSLDRFDDGCDA